MTGEVPSGSAGNADETGENGGSRRASTVLEPEVEAPIENMVQSVARNERLDGVQNYDAARLRDVVSAQRRQRESAPYFNEVEVFFEGEEVEDEVEQRETESQTKRDKMFCSDTMCIGERHFSVQCKQKIALCPCEHLRRNAGRR